MNNIIMNLDLVAIGIYILTVSYCFDMLRREYNIYVSTKQKFKLYAIRDDLAQLVLSGKLDEKSREFMLLRDAINYSISQVGDFSVRKAISIAINCVDKEDILQLKSQETREIAHRYFLATRKMIIRNSRVELFILSIIIKIFTNFKPDNTPISAITELDEKQGILDSQLCAA